MERARPVGKSYVYVWADGVYLQARLEDEARCILVSSAHAGGQKELLGLSTARARALTTGAPAARSQAPGSVDGAQARRRRWRARLLEGDRRGWPRPVSNDAGCIRPPISSTNCQERAAQGQAHAARDLDGETRKDAEAAFDVFVETYGVKYEKVAECLRRSGATARLL